MSTRTLALSAADAVSEEDYQAFLAVLSASARGRAFLGEHARRQQQAHAAALLEAMARLEAQLASQHANADLAQELKTLVESVRSVRSQIDAVQLTAAVTQLAATLDTVQQRLLTLLPEHRAEPKADAKAAAQIEAQARPQPKPVQAPFALALTAVAAQAIAAADAEEEPVKIIKAGTIPPPPPFAGDDFAASELDTHSACVEPAPFNDDGIPRAGAGYDPMMQIMALTEEERLALFS